jgi:hypothetical protein
MRGEVCRIATTFGYNTKRINTNKKLGVAKFWACGRTTRAKGQRKLDKVCCHYLTFMLKCCASLHVLSSYANHCILVECKHE